MLVDRISSLIMTRPASNIIQRLAFQVEYSSDVGYSFFVPVLARYKTFHGIYITSLFVTCLPFLLFPFAGSAALFLLRIGIKGEGGTASVASKSSVKSVERFEGDKAVASMMAVLFVWLFDKAVASMLMAVFFLGNPLLFEDDDEDVAAMMAVLFGVNFNNPEDNEAVTSMLKAVPFVVDLLFFEVASVMVSCLLIVLGDH
jgi:hypothetical protein